MPSITVTVEGMSCQSCVRALENALAKAKGVSSAVVTLGSASIDFDDAATSRDGVIAVIAEAGFAVAA